MTRVVLIGLDGGTFTVLDPFMQRGVMPFLQSFVRACVRARLRTVTPALTPPGWTSMMTGKRPGEHGVFDFFQKESPESEYLHLASSQDIRADTIWSLASRNNCRVIALNFPLTFPPPDVAGCVVPGGWMPWKQLRLGCHPPGLFDRLRALPSFDARELAMDMSLEEKALEGCAPEEHADWITLHTRRERRWADILQYLMRHEPADLIGVVFDGVDKLQHLCWRFLDPACQSPHPSPWEHAVTQLCEAYFRQLDSLIEQIVDLAGPEAMIVLASDHGGGPTSDILYLNSWLEQHGYLAWSDAAEVPTADSLRIGIGQITRHVYELDWNRTVAYAATPSSFGVHLAVGRQDGRPGRTPQELEQLRADLSGELLELRHPATGLRMVDKVAMRDEVFAGPFAEIGPDLSLELADGAVISILRSDQLVKQRPAPLGSHRPEGIFIAGGPGIRSGVDLGELAITDVAPLVLYQLGLGVPDGMSGRVPLAVFESQRLLDHPVRREVSVQAAEVRPVQVESDPESEAVLLRRLRALGYVD